MRQEITVHNEVDEHGNPTGGYVHGMGITISWQRGPLDAQHPQNGAFVEGLIEAVKQRLAFFQEASGGRFACEENESAIKYLELALMALDRRTATRIERNVHGSHTP